MLTHYSNCVCWQFGAEQVVCRGFLKLLYHRAIKELRVNTNRKLTAGWMNNELKFDVLYSSVKLSGAAES